MPELDSWQWIIASIGAFLVGLGKGGVAGVGNITIVLFALIFPAKESVGILLPILIGADIVASIIYRKYANWKIIGYLFPFTILGTFFSYWILSQLEITNSDLELDTHIRKLIGLVLLCMTLLHWTIKYLKSKKLETKKKRNLDKKASFIGVFIGFASMTANAAGPVASLYFMTLKLPKYIYIGTAASLFLLVNLSKVPFQMKLGMIHLNSLKISLSLYIFAIVGALIAPKIVKKINQKWFDRLIWFFIFIAGIKMIQS